MNTEQTWRFRFLGSIAPYFGKDADEPVKLAEYYDAELSKVDAGSGAAAIEALVEGYRDGKPDRIPMRTSVASDETYAAYPAGMRFAARVLDYAAVGEILRIDDGTKHFPQPTIELMVCDEYVGHRAAAALAAYGIAVSWYGLVWDVEGGHPTSRSCRICLVRSYPERADEHPIFVTGVAGC